MNSRVLTWLGGLLIVAGLALAGARLLPMATQLPMPPVSLLIEAANAGLPIDSGAAQVTVFQAGRRDRLVVEGQIGAVLTLPPGRYDAQVVYVGSADRQVQWLMDLQLVAGERAVHEVQFTAGELSAHATVGSADSEQGRVLISVFASGHYDNLITSMAAGDPVVLAAGSYDLRAVWSVEAKEKDVRWYRGVKVAAGLRTRLEVPFDRGTLLVEARNAGEPLAFGQVALTVHRAGDTLREVVDEASAGRPLGLAVGRYDIEAQFTGANDRPRRWLRDVAVVDGEVATRSVDFDAGSVTVEAELAGGEALSAYDVYVYYYPAGDHRQPVTYTPAGDRVWLSAGVYDVRAAFYRSHDQPDVWLRRLQVKPGELQSHRVAFDSGRLMVRAFASSGRELIGDDVFIHVFAAGAHARAIATGRSGEWLTLRAGDYDVQAVDTRHANRSRWLEGVALRAAAAVQRDVRFPE